MLKINYDAVAFPKSIYGRKLFGNDELLIDWHDIIWAAITVGKRNSTQITKHGIYSLYDIINRSMLVWTSLKSTPSYLEKTNVYNEMDPTEKIFVSFFLGMIMSKLFASELLGVPWLEHVSNVNTSYKTRGQTKSRPDLIGLNANKEFVIVEAKGRTNSFSNDAQIKAKQQTKVISTINGIYPVLRVASQCYFKDILKVYIEDPEEISANAIEVEVTVNDYLQKYYSLFNGLEEGDLELLKSMGRRLSRMLAPLVIFYAAFSSAVSGLSGFNITTSTRCHWRQCFDHRSGLALWADSYKAFRFANRAMSCP
jgi:hypothetical protein